MKKLLLLVILLALALPLKAAVLFGDHFDSDTTYEWTADDGSTYAKLPGDVGGGWHGVNVSSPMSVAVSTSAAKNGTKGIRITYPAGLSVSPASENHLNENLVTPPDDMWFGYWSRWSTGWNSSTTNTLKFIGSHTTGTYGGIFYIHNGDNAGGGAGPNN